MKHNLLLAAAGVALMSSAAQAGSLGDIMPSQTTSPVHIKMACGALNKGNCDKVVPRVAAQAAQNNITIEAFESEGTLHSAKGVCAGVVDGAVGQRDGFDQIRRDARNQCIGKFDLIGTPLYPYYAYVVVAADAPYSSFSDMVSSVPTGKFRRVAAGTPGGSGGQTTLGYLLEHVPAFRRVVQPSDESGEMALMGLASKSLDAYFVMDGPGSSLVKDIQSRVDSSGKPQFKFLEVNPPKEFFKNAKDWNGQPLYYQQEIELPGWFNNKYTIATDAVVVYNKDWGKRNQRGLADLGQAMGRASAAIRADMLAPSKWRAQ